MYSGYYQQDYGQQHQCDVSEKQFTNLWSEFYEFRFDTESQIDDLLHDVSTIMKNLGLKSRRSRLEELNLRTEEKAARTIQNWWFQKRPCSKLCYSIPCRKKISK